MKSLRLIALVLLLPTGTNALRAAEPTAASPAVEADKIESRLADYQARLQLTPEQKTQLQPILQENVAWLREWKGRLDATPSRWNRRSLLREARKHQSESEKKIEPLLTESQRKAWQEIREERRAELKAAYKNRPES